jgi:tRNA pseudouridine55 synthase
MTSPSTNPNGIINVDKPSGPSSARVVAQVRQRLARHTRIGHAGTLDPFATGVLLLLVGRSTTRLCQRLMALPKSYDATVKLGATSGTDDPTSPECLAPGAPVPTRQQIQAAVARFVGDILQQPPVYSAIKVGGRRAYQLARQGKVVQLPARTVHVDRMEVADYTWPLLYLRIECGRGTYIRSIARDLGRQLGTGAYLTQLRRTRIGPYHVADAVGLDELLRDGPARFLMSPAEYGK